MYIRESNPQLAEPATTRRFASRSSKASVHISGVQVTCFKWNSSQALVSMLFDARRPCPTAAWLCMHRHLADARRREKLGSRVESCGPPTVVVVIVHRELRFPSVNIIARNARSVNLLEKDLPSPPTVKITRLRSTRCPDACTSICAFQSNRAHRYSISCTGRMVTAPMSQSPGKTGRWFAIYGY